MAIDSFAGANLAMMKVWASDREKLATDEIKAKFDGVVTSPIAPEAAAHFAEFVYANMDAFGPEALEAAADVCDYAAGQRFYGLGEAERGAKISKVLRGKKVADAPLPLAQFDNSTALAAIPADGAQPVPPVS